jgi:hypothetical protein
LRCLISTPLGVPVEPDVYMIHARSSGVGGMGSAGFSSPSLTNSSKLMTFKWGCALFSFSMSWGLGSFLVP